MTVSPVPREAGAVAVSPGAGAERSPTPFDHAERRIWSGKADAYARTYARLCAHPAALLLDAADAGPGSRVLDVGCGSGTISALAAGRGATVHAVDAEPTGPGSSARVLRGGVGAPL